MWNWDIFALTPYLLSRIFLFEKLGFQIDPLPPLTMSFLFMHLLKASLFCHLFVFIFLFSSDALHNIKFYPLGSQGSPDLNVITNYHLTSTRRLTLTKSQIKSGVGVGTSIEHCDWSQRPIGSIIKWGFSIGRWRSLVKIFFPNEVGGNSTAGHRWLEIWLILIPPHR